MISNAFYAFIFSLPHFCFSIEKSKRNFAKFPKLLTDTHDGSVYQNCPIGLLKIWPILTKLLEQNRLKQKNVEIAISKRTFKGGWSWAFNHGGWPSRWAPWQQPQSGPPSTGRGSSGNNRGAGPSWANSSSQRSWHPRQATNKYNSRWETNKQKPITTKENLTFRLFVFLI